MGPGPELLDFDRFLENWQRKPQGLILQSGDGGNTASPSSTLSSSRPSSVEPLTAVDLELECPRDVEVDAGNREVRRIFTSESLQRFRISIRDRLARHPMWWSWDPASIYQLALRFEQVQDPVAFRLSVANDPEIPDDRSRAGGP